MGTTPKSAAEASKFEAEAAKLLAERDKAKAEARRAVAEAARAELELAKARRSERDELAKDQHHHVYVFDKEVAESSVKACIAQLTTWSRQDPGCAIEIVVNSPGGSIFDGFALIDFLRGLRDKGHHITMVALGMAASMAGVLLQAADRRVIGRHCLMLIHEGSLGAIGDFGKVEDRVQLMELMHRKILALFEERSNVTAKWIKVRWQRKDWWLPAEDALKHGFVDEIC